MLRILIAESYPLLSTGMKEVLKTVTASSIATLSNGADLFGFLDQTHFDLLFLDASLTDKNGSALVKHLPCLVKNVTVAVTDTRVNPHEMKKMFHWGIKAFLLKSISEQELITATRYMMKGKKYLQPSVKEYLSELSLGFCKTPSQEHITRREKEVLTLIIEEFTTREIAEKLFISYCTAETHRQHLIKKLGVKNTAGLVREAIQNRLYTSHPLNEYILPDTP